MSTDSKKIANISKSFGAEIPFLRPKKLSADKTNEWDVWQHFAKQKNFNKKDQILIVLPTTSPFRKVEDITKCINYMKSKNLILY